ncbi:MAG: protein dehydratase [Alteromonadaceae bacterium]|nr:MAG: protein dehydratase [Alteromonadaceae bacterium]
MVNVVEYIRVAGQKLQDNQSQLKEILEPQIREISDLISAKITRTKTSYWWRQYFEGLDSSNALIQVPKAKQLYDALQACAGEEIHTSEWFEVDQSRIDHFADVTGDDQWIHVDLDRAKRESPYRSTVAHGFLILSLLPKLTDTTNLFTERYSDVRMVMNCGLDHVRFPGPVKSGARIRTRMTLSGVTPKKKGVELALSILVEVENSTRAGCVADTVVRIYV